MNEQNTYLTKAISAAIEKGGYKITNPFMERVDPKWIVKHSLDTVREMILDPLFWQALWHGLAIERGETVIESIILKAARQSYNEYMDANWKGKIEEFWKELLGSNKSSAVAA
jgi:hypothetical protein